MEQYTYNVPMTVNQLVLYSYTMANAITIGVYMYKGAQKTSHLFEQIK